jgi:membrane-associated protease RseP (regulator of RpoE activity)
LIDSDAAAGPVVVRVTAGSPAAAAGLEVGDVVTSVAGAPVERAHLVRLALLGLEPGLSATLAVERGGSTKEIAVEISASPLVLALGDSRLLPPTVLMQLGSAAQSVTTDVPEWVVQLNRATVFMFARAWEDAVRALRPIRAPVGPGLGQAAVDYWLGIALSSLGPTYTDTARQAFSRASGVEGARLFHNDGPLIAARARARLVALGVAGP